ncbi:MAG: hypothetical protein GY866_32805 [Proteobacteria bacterium]|nr:hypothetical protein [Pseudomonadota bacterium]
MKTDENRFDVSVKSEALEKTKAFILNYVVPKLEDPAKKPKKPYQIIALGSLQYSDNANSSADDKKSGIKVGFIVIPSYKYKVNANSDLLFQGILLREKYLDSDLEAQEVVFTQLDAGWLNKAGFGDWRVDIGYSDIGSKFGLASGDTKVETDLYVSGSFRLKALDNKNVDLGLKYTMKNAAEGEGGYDGDGGMLSLSAAWNRQIAKIKGQLKGGYDMNDAKGAYQDYTAMNLGVDANYPLQQHITIGGALSMKQTSYKERDPLKGDTESSSLTTLSAKGNYQIKQISGLMAGGDLTLKQQSSNISASEYDAMSITLNLIYVY